MRFAVFPALDRAIQQTPTVSSSSLPGTSAVAEVASQHLDGAQRRGVACIALVDNFEHATGNWGRFGWRHRFSARRTKHGRRLAWMFDHRHDAVAPRSADPDRKRRNDQIRSGPSPHFPGLLYRPDKCRGQVTFLTEFASNKIRFKAFFIWFGTPHFAVVARIDRAIR
jgi:hypothetical protein